jgi:hypothetical protein
MRFRPGKTCTTEREALEAYPLMAFSSYLHSRCQVLQAFADEIVENLNKADWEVFDLGGEIPRAEALVWLWTLGAYEVVRTMCQAQRCFSQAAYDSLASLKKTLSGIRMPASKMEVPGIHAPVTSGRDPAGLDPVHRDILLFLHDKPDGVSTRGILAEFDRVLSSIKRQDVLLRHEASYENGA